MISFSKEDFLINQMD